MTTTERIQKLDKLAQRYRDRGIKVPTVASLVADYEQSYAYDYGYDTVEEFVEFNLQAAVDAASSYHWYTLSQQQKE